MKINHSRNDCLFNFSRLPIWSDMFVTLRQDFFGSLSLSLKKLGQPTPFEAGFFGAIKTALEIS